MAEPSDLCLVLFQFFIVTLLQYQVSAFHILLNAGEKILRQGDASKIGYEACESGGPHLIRFRGSEIDTGGNTHQGCQADGIQQDPDPVVKKFPGLVEMPYKYSVDTVPDQKVQEGIGDHTGNIKGGRPSDPVSDYPEHIHNKKVLTDGQGIEDCNGSQPLPDASLECQKHQDGEPDQICRYVKKIVGKYNQSGDYRAGKIDDYAPYFPLSFFGEVGKNPVKEESFCKIR